jgi:alpha-beta hydrolase superfamily lysophospholipase
MSERVLHGVTFSSDAGDDAHEGVSFASTDGTSTCVGDLWLPAGDPRGVVEVCHGMVEHLGCYGGLVRDLTAAGYAVVGTDVIGHGRSCPDHDLRGVYDHVHGADHMIEDLHVLRLGVADRLPGVPIVLLGHSMGSFVVRFYAGRHGEGLAGLVVLGTAWQDSATLAAGALLTDVIALFHGWGYRSRMVDGLGCGGYNKRFEGSGAKTGYEWLSRDESRPLAYAADPDCGWMFSISGYRCLFRLLSEAQDPARIAGVPHDLPVIILSGADDPVGARGDGPVRAFKALKAAGVEDVTLDLFDGARHELLGETCVDEVMEELLGWMSDVVSR